ncbi:MAG: PspA/IM30 family protein, partial [Bacteroidota bacterium]
ERSKWQSKVADAMEQFEVGGMDQTHDEMLTRLNEKTAKNEARIEMAVDSMDTESMKLEEEAENLRAMDLVNQYKMEMGVGAESADTETTSTEEKEKEG